MANVASAFRKASKARRPLLVIVIPDDSDKRWDRGHAFGELLNHGGDEDLAPLADCEVVCASMEGLRKIVPAAGKGEPLMVLVQTEKLPAAALHLDAPMPSYDDIVGFRRRGEPQKEDPDALIGKRIAVLGGLLQKGLRSGKGRLKARAAEARAKLRDKPPAGTYWARTEGCGSIIEGVREHTGMGCGMGFVPARSERFLYFFSADSYN